eukprot:GHVH01000498.1.p1 GENE.GHVH01000498.1~~GHVH01000498.1.p1  ORF type:complete len:668 (-),score=85.83 GHVH01000498.1:1333-3285(-)
MGCKGSSTIAARGVDRTSSADNPGLDRSFSKSFSKRLVAFDSTIVTSTKDCPEVIVESSSNTFGDNIEGKEEVGEDARGDCENNDDHYDLSAGWSQEDMGAIADRFTKIRKLGNGPFGEMIIAREKATGNVRSIKIVKKSLIMRSGGSNQVIELLNELNLVSSMDHPNIMGLYPLYQDKRNFYVVLDHYTGGDLLDLLNFKMRLDESDAAFIMEQVLTGIRYLHSRGVVHRDIKPENIYLDHSYDDTSGQTESVFAHKPKKLRRSTTNHLKVKPVDISEMPMVKIVDFGLATTIETSEISAHYFPLDERIGTSYFIAPEVLNKRYNEKCDMWSCGVLLYTLLCGYPPFMGSSEDEIIRIVNEGTYKWNRSECHMLSREAMALVDMLLSYNPQDRPSADAALRHAWLTHYKPPVVGNACESALINMSLFQKSDKMARLSILFMGKMHTTPANTRPLARTFMALDENGDGRIDRWELHRAFIVYLDKLMVSKQQTTQELKLESPTFTTAEERIRIIQEYEDATKHEDHSSSADVPCFVPNTRLDELRKRRRWALVDSVIESVDFDDNGFIEYSEFITVALDRKVLMSHDTLQAAFNWIDLDGSGSIAAEELKSMYKHITKEEWQAILNDVDADGDGEVDFEEFKVMMANFIL